MDDREDKSLMPVDPDAGLPANIDKTRLQEKSLELINQIIAAEDPEQVKDLTYLFNINQNKKTIVRLDQLSSLQDQLVQIFSDRMSARPDEISNQELMTGMKVIEDMLSRGQNQVSAPQEAPLIQITKQTAAVNIGTESVANVNRASREKVKNFLMDFMNKVEEVAEQAEEEPIVGEGTVSTDDEDK